MASGARRRVGWKPEGPRRWRSRQGSVYDSPSPQGRAPTEGSGSLKLRIPSIHRLTQRRTPLEITILQGICNLPAGIAFDPSRETLYGS